MPNPTNTQLVGFCLSLLPTSLAAGHPSAPLEDALTPIAAWAQSLSVQQQACATIGSSWAGLIHRSTTISRHTPVPQFDQPPLTGELNSSHTVRDASLRRVERGGWELFTHTCTVILPATTPTHSPTHYRLTDHYARPITHATNTAHGQRSGHISVDEHRPVVSDCGRATSSTVTCQIHPETLIGWSQLINDHNPIHCDTSAASSYLPSTDGSLICHGSLLAALGLTMDAIHRPDAAQATLWRISYPSMLPVPAHGVTVTFAPSSTQVILTDRNRPVLRVTYRHTE